MKKFIFAFVGVFFILSNSVSFAASKNNSKKVDEPDTYDYDILVSQISGVKEPYVDGDYLVFTAPKTARNVGIAFDFENFKIIHDFHLHKTINYEGEVTDSWYYFVTKKPKKVMQVSYRLVIDGLWTTDPNNNNTIFDTEEGIYLSQLLIKKADPIITETLESGLTRFVCFADSGQNIRLGGTFTNWDSWIYTMKEVIPGRYEIDIPLPKGTYYYSYYVGITAFIDETNPLKGYSNDGRVVSRIIIK